MTPVVGPELVRGLTQRRAPRPTAGLSRRQLLRALGGAGAVAGLAGCGVAGLGVAQITPSPSVVDAYWAQQKRTDGFVFANWPLYIDVTDSGDYPSLDAFTKKTGMKVTYKVVIQADDSFVGQIQPVLSAGQSSGYDLMVITDGRFLTLLFELGLLVPLDQSRMKNFYAHAAPALKKRSYDPGNTFTMPWQSGITGVAYNPKYVHETIDSAQALFDPKYRGKVGMFGDTEDMPNLALLSMGIDPQQATPAQWRAAAAKLTKQREDGIVRAYYDNGYIDALAKGDIYVTMAYSGDIFQQNISSGTGLKFVVPKEGGLLWTDNMCIPVHAANAYDAMTYMDDVYDPEVAAVIADYVNYITPVEGVSAIFTGDAKDATDADDKSYYTDLASSPLVFPTPTDYERLHSYRTLTASQEIVWDALFEKVYQ